VPVSAADVKTVRERTGAGFIDSKNALEKSQGNIEAAVKDLIAKAIAKGVSMADKRINTAASQGVVESYIHGGGRIGVILELNCETDFVARTDEFHKLAHEIAMQIAAMNPQFIGTTDLPEKPERPLPEISLMHMPYVRDGSRTIKDLVAEGIAKMGESIRIRRFTRYELGG